jgi:hypothetical protein
MGEVFFRIMAGELSSFSFTRGPLMTEVDCCGLFLVRLTAGILCLHLILNEKELNMKKY